MEGIKTYTATGYNSDNGELTLVRIKEAKAVKLVFDDGESTGIDEVNRVESKEDVIYDLQVRRVKNPSKGIYIINGRKVVR